MIFKSYFFIKISPNVYTPRPLSNYIVDADKFLDSLIFIV